MLFVMIRLVSMSTDNTSEILTTAITASTDVTCNAINISKGAQYTPNASH